MNPPARKIFGPPQDKIEPYYFGHKFRKRTGLWLRGLPPLMRGVQVANPIPWVSASKQPKDRAEDEKGRLIGQTRDPKLRARFWTGIARAMAQQWGHLDQPMKRQWIPTSTKIATAAASPTKGTRPGRRSISE